MTRTTIQFLCLQILDEFLFLLNIQRPVIDYNRCQITADLTEHQIVEAIECKGWLL